MGDQSNCTQLNNAMDAWHKKGTCSCGVPVRQCRIWGNVGNILFSNDSGGEHYKISKYQKDIERQVSIIKHMLGLYDPSMIQAYNSYNLHIFKLFKESSSSAKVIIDSSKSVGRAFALLRNAQIDVKIIHLVRDPRGLYYSFQKRDVITPVKNIWSVATYWNGTNSLADMLRSYVGDNQVMRIRYEDLTSRPSETIGQVGEFLNESLTDVKEKIANDVPLGRGHLVSGNRIRIQESTLKLRPDFEWKKKLKLHQRIFLSVVCAPLMLFYGYLKDDF